MKRVAIPALLCLLAAPLAAREPVDYTTANAALEAPRPGEPRIVFVGDSITLFWPERSPGFLDRHGRIARGQAGGESSTQLRTRFNRDVIALHPAAVHILTGINDIARNNGEVPAVTRENIAAMAAAARAAGIKVILASLLPCNHFNLYPGVDPSAAVQSLNTWLQAQAAAHHDIYVDYYRPLATDGGGFRPEYSHDGLHPDAPGYAVMERTLKPLLPG